MLLMNKNIVKIKSHTILSVKLISQLWLRQIKLTSFLILFTCRDEPVAHPDTFYLLIRLFKNTMFIFIFKVYKKYVDSEMSELL